jgi:predicted nucleic acid-binding protein
MNKYFVDTNLFIRYLTNDIPEQADVLKRLISKSVNREIQLVCSTVVIAEIVWTLESFYKFAKSKIDEIVSALVASPAFEFDERDILLQSLDDFNHLNIDFIDAFIGAWMREHQIKNIYTFNIRDFNRISGIVVKNPAHNH